MDISTFITDLKVFCQIKSNPRHCR